MADRDWYCVETEQGTRLTLDGMGTEVANEETALKRAREIASTTPRPLMVVRYTRREVRLFEPKTTVTETDMGAKRSQGGTKA